MFRGSGIVARSEALDQVDVRQEAAKAAFPVKATDELAHMSQVIGQDLHGDGAPASTSYPWYTVLIPPSPMRRSSGYPATECRPTSAPLGWSPGMASLPTQICPKPSPD